MTIDYEQLKSGLASLTGRDLEQAEADERARQNAYPMLDFTYPFRARLAAKALKVRVEDIKDLPGAEYKKVCDAVGFFLNQQASTEEA